MALTVIETDITDKIAVIRKQQVIADADVAALYGVETRRVNVAVKNNVDRFPSDYMFELTKSGLRDLRSKLGMVRVFDVTGRCVAMGDVVGCVSTEGGGRVVFDVPTSGTYLVGIGDYQARKNVVIR